MYSTRPIYCKLIVLVEIIEKLKIITLINLREKLFFLPLATFLIPNFQAYNLACLDLKRKF